MEQIKQMIEKIENCSKTLADYNLSNGSRKFNYTVLEHEIRNDESLITILLKRYMDLKLAEKES